jgi:hypothetical protein
MASVSRQIGWSQESNLLYQILKQLTRLTSVIFKLNPKYKVYTALLTQSGGDNPINVGGGDLIIGGSYIITDNSGDPDFTNVGAPNNDIGTGFVATGTTPNSWGTAGTLSYDAGAPVAIVLENTIGNIWFTYSSPGVYYINSLSLFTDNKKFINGANFITPIYNRIIGEDGNLTDRGYFFTSNSPDIIKLNTVTEPGVLGDDVISNPTCIEIRVYN